MDISKDIEELIQLLKKLQFWIETNIKKQHLNDASLFGDCN